MASVDECRQALHDLADRLDRNAETRGKLDLDRTLAARVTDLRTAFHGRLAGGRLVDIADGDDPRAKIALIAASDDLVALVQGRLDTDIEGAVSAGMDSLLVLSGISDRAELLAAPARRRPTFVAEDVTALFEPAEASDIPADVRTTWTADRP